MRLAGTCSRYSKSAMPQLTIAAMYHARVLRFLRCAYQANVMKTFEQISSPTVVPMTRISSLQLSNAFAHARGLGEFRSRDVQRDRVLADRERLTTGGASTSAASAAQDHEHVIQSTLRRAVDRAQHPARRVGNRDFRADALIGGEVVVHDQRFGLVRDLDVLVAEEVIVHALGAE